LRHSDYARNAKVETWVRKRYYSMFWSGVMVVGLALLDIAFARHITDFRRRFYLTFYGEKFASRISNFNTLVAGFLGIGLGVLMIVLSFVQPATISP
jgi:hypothetical protein